MLIPYVVIGHNSTEESLKSNDAQCVHEPYDRIFVALPQIHRIEGMEGVQTHGIPCHRPLETGRFSRYQKGY
jgi:hypothetical protein